MSVQVSHFLQIFDRLQNQTSQEKCAIHCMNRESWQGIRGAVREACEPMKQINHRAQTDRLRKESPAYCGRCNANENTGNSKVFYSCKVLVENLWIAVQIRNKAGVHKYWAPNFCRSSVQNVLHVTFFAPRTLRWLLEFWKNLWTPVINDYISIYQNTCGLLPLFYTYKIQASLLYTQMNEE